MIDKNNFYARLFRSFRLFTKKNRDLNVRAIHRAPIILLERTQAHSINAFDAGLFQTSHYSQLSKAELQKLMSGFKSPSGSTLEVVVTPGLGVVFRALTVPSMTVSQLGVAASSGFLASQIVDLPGAPSDYEVSWEKVRDTSEGSVVLTFAVPKPIFDMIKSTALDHGFEKVEISLLSCCFQKVVWALGELDGLTPGVSAGFISSPMGVTLFLCRDGIPYSVELDVPPQLSRQVHDSVQDLAIMQDYLAIVVDQIKTYLDLWQSKYGEMNLDELIVFGLTNHENSIERAVKSSLSCEVRVIDVNPAFRSNEREAYRSAESFIRFYSDAVAVNATVEEKRDQTFSLPSFSILKPTDYGGVFKLLYGLASILVVSIIILLVFVSSEVSKVGRELQRLESRSQQINQNFELAQLELNNVAEWSALLSAMDMKANFYLEFLAFLEKTLPPTIKVERLSFDKSSGVRVAFVSLREDTLSAYLRILTQSTEQIGVVMLAEDVARDRQQAVTNPGVRMICIFEYQAGVESGS